MIPRIMNTLIGSTIAGRKTGRMQCVEGDDHDFAASDCENKTQTVQGRRRRKC